MEKIKNLALVAHDNRKADLIAPLWPCQSVLGLASVRSQMRFYTRAWLRCRSWKILTNSLDNITTEVNSRLEFHKLIFESRSIL